MKKNYLFIAFLFCSMMFGQNIDFNNGAADGGLWTSTNNWTPVGIPTATSIVRISNSAVSFVNQNFTILSLQNLSSATTDRFVNSSSGGILTIDVNNTGDTGVAIQNVSSTGGVFGLRGKINIQNTNATKFSRITNANNAANSIDFQPTSVLTITTPLEIFKAAVATSANNFFFNGKIEGTANLRIAANTTATFGNSVSNAGYTGQIVLLGTSSIVVNTADNVIFYDGPKIQVNGTGASTTLNGANVFKSGITVGPGHTFGFNVNKNQNSMTAINLGTTSKINMAIAPSVTEVAFAAQTDTWSTGTLNITGYESGEIRFGTDNTGLTAAQLLQITADGAATGQALALDANGYLVLASSLSSDSFDLESQKRISYPTVVDNQIYFSKPQNKVEIFNITGSKVFAIANENGIDSVPASDLSQGMYIIVFDGVKVEKFMKK